MIKSKAKFIAAGAILLCAAISLGLSSLLSENLLITAQKQTSAEKPIKWVEFDVPYEVMKEAMDIDIETYNNNIHINWVDILAYLGAKYGGQFDYYQSSDMTQFVNKIKKGCSPSSLTKDMKYFDYYSRAYGAILNGFLGEYQIKLPDKKTKELTWKKAYGLKAFSPVAEGYYYSDFDDFGENRSYGYSRRHLGHDMITSVGTPVVAVESGTVEALGWNQYGGWRIGIRSYDKERYYYYAHLRKDSPFADNLYIGAQVTGGDVIGYTGQTGYSIKENVNNIDTPHLHFGLQLIFEEDAKDSPTQIWIDLFDIARLLSTHRCTVVEDKKTHEYKRKYPFIEDNYYLNEIQTSVPTTNSKEVELPVLMYHSLLKDPSRQNQYVVSPDLFEKDLKYIKDKGYTTVFMKDVIDYVEGKGKLPKKPIVITFDDGYYNNYYYAFPLLKKYNMKAVISVVGKMSDEFTNNPDENPNYSHLTWDHILEMHMSGHWEIQNHSYDCHTYTDRNGVSQKKDETVTAYKDFLTSDIYHLQNKIAYVTGVAPNTFTYPFGAFSEKTDDVIKEMGFKATLGCTEGVSIIKKGEPQCLYKIKRHLRPPDKSSREFFDFLR
ncbi:MAG: polysaccharide deacetylase family protein [Clostridiales bacterium]|nr:polysaccharide deacetylase family protein [Clostridiales bacterium]